MISPIVRSLRRSIPRTQKYLKYELDYRLNHLSRLNLLNPIHKSFHSSVLFCTSVNDLLSQIKAKGDEIRSLKESKAEKSQITPVVESMLALKAEFHKITGSPYDPPKEGNVKKEKVPDADATTEQQGKKEKLKPIKEEVLSVVEYPRISYFDIDQNDGQLQFGDYDMIQSNKEIFRSFTDTATLGTVSGPKEGDKVTSG